MPVVVSSAAVLKPCQSGWTFHPWASSRVVARGSDRRHDATQLLAELPAGTLRVEAEQVHGGSVAIVRRMSASLAVVPGADALLTDQAGIALLVRSADCLPLFIADPRRGVVGIAHVGWRGLVAQLPMRLVAAMRHAYQSAAATLRVAIGPAIRACCYEVGPEFVSRFGPFVRERGTRRTCDLAGAAVHQLGACGIPRSHVMDSQACTACDGERWYSLRRDGPATGRLTSLIMWRR